MKVSVDNGWWKSFGLGFCIDDSAIMLVLGFLAVEIYYRNPLKQRNK